MTDFEAIDFFRDDAVVEDPYPYFESLREQCPVLRERHHDVVMVTGWDEAVGVYNDTETFSSCNAVTGHFPGSRYRSSVTMSPRSSSSIVTSSR